LFALHQKPLVKELLRGRHRFKVKILTVKSELIFNETKDRIQSLHAINNLKLWLPINMNFSQQYKRQWKLTHDCINQMLLFIYCPH